MSNKGASREMEKKKTATKAEKNLKYLEHIMERKLGEFDTHRKYWTQKVQTEIKRNLRCHLVYMEFKMTCGTNSKTVNTKDLQWIGSCGDP